MSVTTTKFIRKPLYVDAVKITGANFDEVADWCQGEVQTEGADFMPGQGPGKKYIFVRVHNPKSPRQTKAFVGDWLLYTERGYKVYTNKAFHASFDEVLPESEEESENGGVVLASQEVIPGVTLSEALAWLGGQPEKTLDQIRELVQSGEACSIRELNIERAERAA